MRQKLTTDPVKIKATIAEPAIIQHQGLMNTVKAMIHLGNGNPIKSVKKMSFDEKDYPKVHPSCASSNF